MLRSLCQRVQWLVLAMGVAFGGCDGSVGCVACGEGYVYPDPPPAGGQIMPDTLIGQLQESGVRFVLGHLSDILRTRFPTRTAGGIERAIIYLPDGTVGNSDGSVGLTIRDGCIEDVADLADCPARVDPGDDTGPTYRSRIELNLDTIDDTFDATFLHGAGPNPDSVRISLFDVDVFVDLAVMIEAGILGDATCWVQDSNVGLAGIHLEQLRFTVTLEVDANDAFYAEVSDVQVDVADLINLDVDPCNAGASALPALCDDPTCHDGWISFECGLYCGTGDFVFTAASWLDDFLSPLAEWALPPVIESLMASVLAEVNGTPLAISGRYEVADIFGAEGRLAPLLMEPTAVQFGAFPNEDAFRLRNPTGERGMMLSLDAGTGALASPCVPTVTIPSFYGQLGDVPVFDGRVTVNGQPESYDIVLATSEAFIAQGAHTAFRLGGGCWEVSSDDMERLTGGAISLGALAVLVPSLAEVGEPRAPLMFQVHPTAAPTVQLGSGEVIGQDEHGDAIVDSLIQVDLGEVGLSVYAFVDDGYVRLATVAADVFLGVPLVRTPHNTLELGIDGVEITNLIEVYNEVLGATDFGELFEVMISLTMTSVLENVGSFDLDLAPIVSRMTGGAPVYARINAVQREGDAQDGYLVSYVTMCDEEDLSDPTKPPCYTPPPGPGAPPPRLANLGPSAERGVATLTVNPTGEYQARVDGTAWTGFRAAAGGTLAVRHPLLRVPGRHRIEVRRRERGAYWTLQPVPDRVDVTIE